jgi:hypothetical protein
MRANGPGSRTPPSDSALAEPAAGVFVPEDNRVLAALEDDVEIAPLHRLLGPPAIDDAPLLTDERYRPAVDFPRRPVEVRLDENRPWSV